MKPIILASSSPRRKELLEKLGLKFQVVKVDFEEDMNLHGDPLELAGILSEGKAQSVVSKFSAHIIISADTFVVLNGEFLGKPHTPGEAEQMLKKISGHEVSVITGYTIVDSSENRRISRAVKTKVFIKILSDGEIAAYVKTGEPLDKAGAFAIQGIGSIIVEKIEGDFYNVMGLPLFDLAESLKEFGVHILE